ncbi:MAG: hypothetical protein WAM69_11655 [Candidatus Sulfotelmatobacter sp.]
MSKAVFLDLDGVVNRKPSEGQYVTRWEELHVLPGVVEAIALLNRAGFRVILARNQRCEEHRTRGREEFVVAIATGLSTGQLQG